MRSFVILYLTKHYQNDHMKGDKVATACSMHGRCRKCISQGMRTQTEIGDNITKVLSEKE
jgi:hypothetical protein